MNWKDDIWHVNKSAQKEDYLYGMTEAEVIKISTKMMKKVYKHGDTSDSGKEFVEDHPEYFNLSSWKEKKKMLKKRFPYLTSIELDFLGKVSKGFEEDG